MKISLIALLLTSCAAFDTPRVNVPWAVIDVNENINKTIYYADDQNWGQEDYWATPKEFYAKGGDCEDYAISKYFALRKAGIPAKDLMMTNILLDDGDTNHMVLMYKDFVLDNIVSGVTPVNEYLDFKLVYKFNEDGFYVNNTTLPPNYLLKWGSVIRKMEAGG